MSSTGERRLLVYQCGARSVVNLSNTRASTRCSPSPLHSSAWSSAVQPQARHFDSAAEERAASEAEELSSLRSPCSSLTVASVTLLDGACEVEGALTRAALSPPPRPPPPPPSAPSCAAPPLEDSEATTESSVHVANSLPRVSVQSKEPRIRTLASLSVSQSTQGTSRSPIEHAHVPPEHADVGAQRTEECRVTPASREPQPAGEMTRAPLARPATAIHAKTREPRATHQLTGEEPAIDRIASSCFVACTAQHAMRQRDQPTRSADGADSAVQERASGVELSSVTQCCRSATPAVTDAHVEAALVRGAVHSSCAERSDSPESDDDEEHRSGRVQAREDVTATDTAAAAAPSAYTPRRPSNPMPHDMRGKALPLAKHCVGAAGGGGGSTDCSSQEHFSVHYATTSVSGCTTPETSSIRDPAAVAAVAGPSPPVKSADADLKAKKDAHPGDIPLPSAVSPQPRGDVTAEEARHHTPSACTTSEASATVSAVKTPTPSPLRRELLLRRLLAAHTTPSADTPSGHSAASAASSAADGGALLATPTPLHTSRVKDAAAAMAAATPRWESPALITGFPTPVKLSPIPTKGHISYAGLMAATAAGALSTARGAVLDAPATRTAAVPAAAVPPASTFSSPALSVIAEAAELRGVATPTLDAAVSVTSVTEADPFEASQSARSVECRPAARPLLRGDEGAGADSLSTDSACSISPIRVRAAQTTRVWTPQSSDASQHPQHLTHLASLVDATAFSSRLVPQGSGLALTGDERRSTAMHQPQLPSPQRNSTVGATVLMCTADSATATGLSGHSNPSRGALPFDRATEEVAATDWATTSTALAEGPRRVAHAWTCQPRRLAEPERQPAERAQHTASLEPCTAGRTSPRLLADTVNLGTPSVSMILTPAQALGDSSSSSLFMPPATQYIQALPIPGFGRQPQRGNMAAVAQPTRQTACLDVRALGGVETKATEALPAESLAPRHSAVLLSPAFDEERSPDAGRAHGVEQTRGGAPPLAPSPSAHSSFTVSDVLPQRARRNEGAGEQLTSDSTGRNVSAPASATETSVSSAHHPGRAERTPSWKVTQRAASSGVAPEQGLSPSEGRTPPQVRRAPHRWGHVTATEEGVRVRYRPTFTASSLAATYNIDSWL